jgi:hypothetical protein
VKYAERIPNEEIQSIKRGPTQGFSALMELWELWAPPKKGTCNGKLNIELIPSGKLT